MKRRRSRVSYDHRSYDRSVFDTDRSSIGWMSRPVYRSSVRSVSPAPVRRGRSGFTFVRQVARPPVRSRLRTVSPFRISEKFMQTVPHGTRREALGCVRHNLSRVRELQGSGGGSHRRVKSRQDQRRQIFQAARKSC